MKDYDEKDLMNKFAHKMLRVDEILIKKVMDEEGISREEAEARLKELQIINGETYNLNSLPDTILERGEKLLKVVLECFENKSKPDQIEIEQFHDLLQEMYNKNPAIFKGEIIYLWETLGWAYYLLGDMNKSEKCLRIQAELQPGSSEPYLNLGSFYDNYGMECIALKIYMEGLERFPGEEYLSYNLAVVLKRCGLNNTAEKYLNDALLKKPDCPHNLKLMGDLMGEKNKLTEAAYYYKKAIKSFGTVQNIEKEAAEIALNDISNKMKKTEEEEKPEKTTLEIFGENPELFEELKKSKEYIAFYKKLVEIETTFGVTMGRPQNKNNE